MGKNSPFFTLSIPVVNHSLSYNPSLDGLRGVAISFVLLFHIWPEYFSFGYVGVDIFFVLSGFLITQIIYTKLQTESFSFKIFYRNRIRRIFPAMIVVLLSAFLLGYLLLFPTEFQQLGRHIESSAFFYQNFRLIGEVGYWDKAAQLKPLLHFWSLSIEEQFYIFWPLLIFLLYKFKKNLSYSLFTLFIILLLIPILLNTHPFYHSLSRFWELSFGGFVYAFIYHHQIKKLYHQLQLPILMFFIISIAIAFDNTAFSLLKTLSIVISSGLIIVLLHTRPYHRFFSAKPLIVLGLISFPLYLWHYVLISYGHILGFNISRYGYIFIFLSILLSYFTYRYIELYSRKQSSLKLIFGLFLCVVIIGLLGHYTAKKQGFPTRSHLNNYQKYAKQFIRTSSTNTLGISLTTKLLGHPPTNDYIKASSNNTNKNFIVIVGDSHAHTAYPGFMKLAKTNGYETLLLANSSCPPYVKGAMGKTLKELQQCNEKIENIYKVLQSDLPIKKVIFVTRGPIYMYDIGYGIIDHGNTPLHYHFQEFFIAKTPYLQQTLFFKKVKNTFQFFETLQSADFYYILENPELGFSPQNCLPRPFVKTRRSCKLSYQEYLKRSGEYKKSIFSLASEYPNIHILDPERFYCDDMFCYAMRHGTILYADDDHHSLDGSLLQAEYFKRDIFEQ